MKRLKWGIKKERSDYSRLETYLEEIFQPVEPRAEYVRRLRHRIISQYRPVREEVKQERQRTVMLIGASLVGGVLTLLMGIRVVLAIIATITLFLQWKKENQDGRVAVFRRIT